MPTNLSKNLKTYVIPLVSIVVVVFLVPTVILPQFQKIKENWDVVSKDNERLERLEAKAQALNELADASDELDRKLAVAESALPIEKDVARLVRGVQGVAASTGLEVTKVKIIPGKTATESAAPAATQTNAQAQTGITTASTTSTAAPASSKSELIFELNLKGSLAAFQSFLKSIEGTKRLLILSSLKSTSETGDSHSFTVLINAPFGPLPTLAQDQLSVAIAELSASNEKLLDDLESSAFKDVTNQPLPTGPTGVADPFR